MNTIEPARKPMAIPTPWGEMATRPPKRKRSNTLHEIEAIVTIEAVGITPLLYRGGPRRVVRQDGGRYDSRPHVGHGPAQQQPPQHVGWKVHTDAHARDRNRSDQSPSRSSSRGGRPEIAERDREEREQHGRVAAR